MRAQTLPLILSLALSSYATPFEGHGHQHLHRQAYSTQSAAAAQPSSAGGDTFEITVHNDCATDLQFGIFQVSSSFSMDQVTTPLTIASGSKGSIAAPYQGIGMRLSASAGEGTAAQWDAQALFEFGYSTYNGIAGTAYDLSVMGGTTGLAVYPANKQCPSKVCTASDSSPDQCWTNADQVDAGSPADTVCYYGKSNFRVVWCPKV